MLAERDSELLIGVGPPLLPGGGPALSFIIMDSKLIALGIAILAQAGGVIWWASSLEGRVAHNNYQIQIMQPDLEEAISFTKLWPAGKWGSGELPSDTRQDLKIEAMEKQLDKLMTKVYEMNNGSH